MKKPSWAVLLVVALMAALCTACSSDRDDGNFVVTAKTGVVVSGPEKVIEGKVTAAKATNPPKMPKQFRQVGEITEVKGKLKGYVTITLPIPHTVENEHAHNLRVMRHNGRSWGAMPRQQIDLKKRTVSVTTSEFSLWGLSTWDAEQAAAELAADVRNQLSSGGLWIVGSIGRLVTNPPVTECHSEALTLKLDARRFVPRAILCPKLVKEDKQRNTYRVHVSNMQAYPVMLRLPQGVRTISMNPPPNVVSQTLVRALGRSRGVTILPGAAELVLEVKAGSLPDDAKISGTLDFTGVAMDVGMAAIRTITGYDWDDRVVTAIGNTQEFIDYAGCVVDGSEKLAKAYKKLTASQMAGEISKTALGCMSTELAAQLFKDYVKAKYKAFNYDKRFAEWFQQAMKRLITNVENAHVIPEVVATLLAAKFGQTEYALGIQLNDPALDVLYKALPIPGEGGFTAAPSRHDDGQPKNGIYLTFVGTACTARDLPQDWPRWRYEPDSPAGSARGAYYRGEKVSVGISAVYVPPQHRPAVSALFGNLVHDKEPCEYRNGANIANMTKYNGPSLGGLVDYRVGRTGWEDDKKLPGSPAGYANLYDPAKGLVLQMVVLGMERDTSEEVITREMSAAVSYTASKLDVRIGTSFTLK